ncbi:MAG: zinc metallopeptidase [Thermoanaerobaculia bacterium]
MENTLYYVIAGLVFLFSLAVRQHLKSTYQRWSQVRSATGRPGGQVARMILDANRLQTVPVEPVQGKLTDHYDPRHKLLRLARDNFVGNSVAATAVAAHECGHALQDADDYRPMEFRTAMVPIANAGARFGLPLAIFGSFYGSTAIVQIGILGYVGSILLTFLTLPVEFNASKRALSQLDRLDLVSADGREGAKKVLRAAAMTYVAGVASSAWYLVYLLFVGARSLLRKPAPPLPPRL